MKNILGKSATFRYPDYGTPNGYPDYTAHSGQVVTVVQKLGPDEVDPEVGEMFVIRATDGWEGHALREELTVHRKAKT